MRSDIKEGARYCWQGVCRFIHNREPQLPRLQMAIRPTLDVEQSPNAWDAFCPIPGLISCAGVTGPALVLHSHMLHSLHVHYNVYTMYVPSFTCPAMNKQNIPLSVAPPLMERSYQSIPSGILTAHTE